MEAYVTTCHDCGHSRHWTGYKTGFGKTKEQLAQMSKDMNVCIHCNSTNTALDLDHDSPLGRALDGQATAFGAALIEALSGKPKS